MRTTFIEVHVPPNGYSFHRVSDFEELGRTLAMYIGYNRVSFRQVTEAEYVSGTRTD